MSIFVSIMSRIFSRDYLVPHLPLRPARQMAGGVPAATSASRPRRMSVPPPQAIRPVDVEQVLSDMSEEKSQRFDWRTSVADLLKLLDLDSSLEGRKALARELRFAGDMEDSESRDGWLHKQVMKKLADSGGIVPPELLNPKS